MSDFDKPRLARLTAILTQLQSKRMLTAREIADKHHVSIRTVYRDIRTLERSGVPIVTEEGRGYTLMEGYSLPPVSFTEEEAHALITAEAIIRQNKDESLVAHYLEAATKIKSVMRHQQQEKVELLADRISVRSGKLTEHTSNHLIALQKAITNRQVADIAYQSLRGQRSTRSVEPFAMYNTRENWVLVAWCQLRQDYRAFRLDCIHECFISSATFEPHNMTLQQYFEYCRQKFFDPQPTPDTPLSPANGSFAPNQHTTTMQSVQVEPFKIIGISVRTSNPEGQSAKDIPGLWQRFMAEDVVNNIPNKLGMEMYAVYNEYDGDHMAPYTMTIGCKVSTTDNVPEGMNAATVQGGSYQKFTASGDLTGTVLGEAWGHIWQAGLNRAYTSDFEVYDERAMNPKNGTADILVALS